MAIRPINQLCIPLTIRPQLLLLTPKLLDQAHMHRLRINQQFQARGRISAVERRISVVVVEVVDCQRCCCLINDARKVLPAEVNIWVERKVAAISTVQSPDDGAVRRDEVGREEVAGIDEVVAV